MLSFFRRYQKIVFIFVTVLTVLSFGFFGTYRAGSTAFTKKPEDKLLYKAPLGRKISQSYFKKMVRFLEAEPAFSYDLQRVIASNPLNDGVISKDFLAQGFSDIVLTQSGLEALEEKFEKEKKFVPYVHPFQTELRAEAIWSLFAPELKTQLSLLTQNSTARRQEAIAAREALYLMHQRFNGDMLKQVIRYQEYQAQGRTASDPFLINKELALFGYKNVSDWFGEEFTERVAKLVIHGSQLAKMQGLKVSKDELFADLYGRAQICYKSLQQRGELPIGSSEELVKIVAHALQMDESDLCKIWEDVLYFRRLLDEKSGSIVIDPLTLEKFTDFAHKAVTLKVCQMGEELRFSQKEELAPFEMYLEAVCGEREDLLKIPSHLLSQETIACQAPELIGRRYWITVKELNKEELSSKISLKELWDWQEQNYALLQKNFSLPDYAQFEELSLSTRHKVDQFSYGQMIACHPEWMGEVLATKKEESRELFLRFAQNKSDFPGISDQNLLRELLDKNDTLIDYSQDGMHYYTICVERRGIMGEILSYSEAKKSGALADLMERKKGSTLIDRVLATVKADLLKKGLALPKEDIDGFCVRHRFYNYLSSVQKDASYLEGFSSYYAPHLSYKNTSRSHPSLVSFDEVVKGKGSSLRWDQKEGLYFYQVDGEISDTTVSTQKYYLLQQWVSRDVRRQLIKQLIQEI